MAGKSALGLRPSEDPSGLSSGWSAPRRPSRRAPACKLRRARTIMPLRKPPD